jgi:hypothetical protein
MIACLYVSCVSMILHMQPIQVFSCESRWSLPSAYLIYYSLEIMRAANDSTKSRYAAVSTGALLHVYHAGYTRLNTSVKDLTQRQLNAHPVKNKWSIGAVIMHVVLTEIQGAAAIRQMLVTKDAACVFFGAQTYKTNPVDGQRFTRSDISDHLELFRLLRVTTGKIFEHATDRENPITDKDVYREIFLRCFLEFYADHSERHLAQVLERRKLLGRPMNMEMILPVRLY